MKLRELLIVFSVLAALSPLRLMAQDDWQAVHGDCMPAPADGRLHAGVMKLPIINTDWDASRAYKQLVILVSFVDEDFHRDDIKNIYERMFNESGYNEGFGPGSVADYFHDQSHGLLNLSFDVYGPYAVSQKSQPYDEPNSFIRNYGRESFAEATNKLIEENPEMDFSPYDWNGDGYVNQVIYVYAGVSGNLGSKTYGHIWPNSSSFTTITTPDGLKISNYSASGETLPTSTQRSAGIGTICHEFTHSLGLPDIYPVSTGWTYTAVDEWDLMDGGNFTNYGWCPPNYSPLEKMLLGWLSPIELTEGASITELKPVADGGEVYMLKHIDDEYLLLENRQWSGWDAGLPGKGLVIYHVDYIPWRWAGNCVNGEENKLHYSLVHADNLDYNDWTAVIANLGYSTYRNSQRMNKYHLSSSPYPWSTDSTTFVNHELTDTSVPAAVMYNENAIGSTLLEKPITNIMMSEDGLVSFNVLGAVGINHQTSNFKLQTSTLYDLSGRRVETPVHGNIYIMKHPDGTVSKQIYRND